MKARASWAFRIGAAVYLVLTGVGALLSLPSAVSLLMSDQPPFLRLFYASGVALWFVHALLMAAFGVLVLRRSKLAAYAAFAAAGALVIRIVGLVASSSVVGFFPPFVAVAFLGALAASLVLTIPDRDRPDRRTNVGRSLIAGRAVIAGLAGLALVWTLVQVANGRDSGGIAGLFGAALVERWAGIAAFHLALAVFSLGAPRTALVLSAATDLGLGLLLVVGSFPLEGGVLLGGSALVALALLLGGGGSSSVPAGAATEDPLAS
jgi:hypothetical protein